MQPGLTAYWIRSPLPHAPLGFGVTARSLDDALSIILHLGYERYLPSKLSQLEVLEDVAVADLKHAYVLKQMGPIVVRGMWYPFCRIGVPERLD